MSKETISPAIFEMLDKLLVSTDISNVTSESSGFEDLPEGYFLSEVEKAELTVSKSSGQPMVAFQFKVIQDGVSVDIDDIGTVHLTTLPKTANRKLFKYYVLKDEQSIKRFVADMLKFEGEVEGESLLPKEAFTRSETLADALSVLIGMRIYINISKTEKDGVQSSWSNLISWKRVSALELP